MPNPLLSRKAFRHPVSSPAVQAQASQQRSYIQAAGVLIHSLLPLRLSSVASETGARSDRRLQIIALRIWQVLRLFLVLVPLYQIGTILKAIRHYTPHVPYWDEWDTVLLVHKASQGTLQVGDFFAFHNEHRIVIPTIISVILIELTHWNRQILMTFNMGIAALTGALLFWAMRRTLESLDAALLLAVPMALLFFSFTEFQNWLWAFQITFLLTVTGAAFCLWVLSSGRTGWREVVWAALGALVASLSSLSGLFVWIAFLPAIARMGYRKAAAWTASAVVVWALYFVGFPKEPHHPFTVHDAVDYVLAYLGGPLGFPDVARAQRYAAFGIALLIVNLAVYWLLHRNVTKLLPWVGLALFAFGCAAATAYGRIQYGTAEAVSSRYHAFSGLWWLSLFIMVGVSVVELIRVVRAKSRWAIASMASLALLLAVLNVVAVLVVSRDLMRENTIGYQILVSWQVPWLQNEQCIAHYQTAPDSCLSLYYPHPPQVRIRAAYLQQEHMGIFSTSTGSR